MQFMKDGINETAHKIDRAEQRTQGDGMMEYREFLDRTLPHRDGKDPEDERHVHPLQLDVIERCCILFSNPGENVLTPFMGVGSEVYGAILNKRRGIGIELKGSYYRQAVRNLDEAASKITEQGTLL